MRKDDEIKSKFSNILDQYSATLVPQATEDECDLFGKQVLNYSKLFPNKIYV